MYIYSLKCDIKRGTYRSRTVWSNAFFMVPFAYLGKEHNKIQNKRPANVPKMDNGWGKFLKNFPESIQAELNLVIIHRAEHYNGDEHKKTAYIIIQKWRTSN